MPHESATSRWFEDEAGSSFSNFDIRKTRPVESRKNSFDRFSRNDSKSSSKYPSGLWQILRQAAQMERGTEQCNPTKIEESDERTHDLSHEDMRVLDVNISLQVGAFRTLRQRQAGRNENRTRDVLSSTRVHRHTRDEKSRV